MMRPLFEPLSDDHARPDEWSWPLGFVIGGMATYADQSEREEHLAGQYFTAAEALVDAILDKRVADYEVANAALFLYRHCIELLLKAGLPSQVRARKNIHHLGNLAKSYAHHQQRAGRTVPAWVIGRCEELASIDPGSEAFRYGECGVPEAKNRAPLVEEIHVNLVHLKDTMKTLNAALAEQNRLIRMERVERP